MDVQSFDWVFLAVLMIVMPLAAIAEHRWLVARTERGDPTARRRFYWLTILVDWPLCAALLAFWMDAGRDLSLLGLGAGNGIGAWIGWGLALLACGLLVTQTLLALRNPQSMASVRRQVLPLRAIIPHSQGDARLFAAVSVTAGVCEELLFRGYLIALFTAMFNVWTGVVFSSLVFGIGHAYQGASGVVKTAILGLVFAGIYKLTGSLWAAMLLHAAIDLNSGYLGRRALANHDPHPEQAAA